MSAYSMTVAVLAMSLCMGCAASTQGAEDLERKVPVAQLEMHLDGHGQLLGRASYVVVEPIPDYEPEPRLVLAATSSTVELTIALGQSGLWPMQTVYEFPAPEHYLYLTFEGQEYEGTAGRVSVADIVDGRLTGRFEVTAKGVERADDIMVSGEFDASKVFLNCDRVVGDEPLERSSPGTAAEGDQTTWTPDVHYQSAFCAEIKEKLSGFVSE